MKQWFGGPQTLFEVGDQIGRQEISKAPFGEETERGVAGVENRRVQFRPIGDADERRDRLTWLTTLVASLQKGITGVLCVSKGLADVLDDPLLGLHCIHPLACRPGPSLVKRVSFLSDRLRFTLHNRQSTAHQAGDS